MVPGAETGDRQGQLAKFGWLFLRYDATLYMMRHDNACRIVAGSSLMGAIYNRYGCGWVDRLWVRVMLAGFVGALEGAAEPDPVLDEMEHTAKRIGAGA